MYVSKRGISRSVKNLNLLQRTFATGAFKGSRPGNLIDKRDPVNHDSGQPETAAEAYPDPVTKAFPTAPAP